MSKQKEVTPVYYGMRAFIRTLMHLLANKGWSFVAGYDGRRLSGSKVLRHGKGDVTRLADRLTQALELNEALTIVVRHNVDTRDERWIVLVWNEDGSIVSDYTVAKRDSFTKILDGMKLT